MFKQFSLILIFLYGCGAASSLLDKIMGSADQSIFASYAGQNCRMTDNGFHLIANLPCDQLRHYLNATSPQCTGVFANAHFGFFPDRPDPIRLCKHRVPRFDTSENIRFLLFGDAGRGENPSKGYRQFSVAQAMQSVCPPRQTAREPGCDFAIVPGDLIYPSGIRSPWDERLREYFEQPYLGFNELPFYLVPGNHDYAGNVTSMVEYSHFSRRWRMPERFYALDHLPAWLRIVALDTQAFTGDDAEDNYTEQRQLLMDNFCDFEGWKFAFGHFPPWSNGAHGSHSLTRQRLTEVYDRCPFHFFFAGHEHHQEHISTQLWDTFIQGAGGTSIRPVKQVQDPSQVFALADHGFAVVTVTQASVRVQFYALSSWSSPRHAQPEDFVYSCTAHAPSTQCLPD